MGGINPGRGVIQEGFAQTAALGVLLRSECGSDIEAKVSIYDAFATDLKRHQSESQHMQWLCSGFEATLRRKSTNGMLVHN